MLYSALVLGTLGRSVNCRPAAKPEERKTTEVALLASVMLVTPLRGRNTWITASPVPIEPSEFRSVNISHPVSQLAEVAQLGDDASGFAVEQTATDTPRLSASDRAKRIAVPRSSTEADTERPAEKFWTIGAASRIRTKLTNKVTMTSIRVKPA